MNSWILLGPRKNVRISKIQFQNTKTPKKELKARPVSSLSGGETFLVSLSLALALSGKIQLNSRNPLEFFFLDEGFGTLDPRLLEVVMDSLEKLRGGNLTIGVISHVPELRNRISRRIIVIPASVSGDGSRIRIEKSI